MFGIMYDTKRRSDVAHRALNLFVVNESRFVMNHLQNSTNRIGYDICDKNTFCRIFRGRMWGEVGGAALGEAGGEGVGVGGDVVGCGG